VSFLVATVAALGVLLVYDGIAGGGRRPRAAGLHGRLDALAAESGARNLSGGGLAVLSAVGFVAGFVVTAALTGAMVVAVAVAGAASWLPIAFARSRRARRRRAFREAWPDAIATLIASVRAGTSLPEACAALLTRGPEQLRPGFDAFFSSYRATGSFEAALARLRAELADPVADRVTLALRMAAQVGGTDLVRVLRTLSDFVREDLRVRREIEARWSWTVTAARVAAGAPWAVLVMMSLRPEAAAAYNSASGTVVIACGAAATFAGYRLMLRAARLPEEKRIGA
jgi:tight adherence protein B